MDARHCMLADISYVTVINCLYDSIDAQKTTKTELPNLPKTAK